LLVDRIHASHDIRAFTLVMLIAVSHLLTNVPANLSHMKQCHAALCRPDLNLAYQRRVFGGNGEESWSAKIASICAAIYTWVRYRLSHPWAQSLLASAFLLSIPENGMSLTRHSAHTFLARARARSPQEMRRKGSNSYRGRPGRMMMSQSSQALSPGGSVLHAQHAPVFRRVDVCVCACVRT